MNPDGWFDPAEKPFPMNVVVLVYQLSDIQRKWIKKVFVAVQTQKDRWWAQGNGKCDRQQILTILPTKWQIFAKRSRIRML